MKQTVRHPLRFEGDPVKGSRFIVDVILLSDEDEARAQLLRVAAEFSDASHHCWAWRVAAPAVDRASDDGEPSGSAGRPILAQLSGRDLVNAGVIVTRYFGGTKLGVGGLVRAYGGAAGAALDQAETTPWVPTIDLHFQHEYSLTDAIERLVSAAGGVITRREFGEVVLVQLQLPVDAQNRFVGAISDLSAGAIECKAHDTL